MIRLGVDFGGTKIEVAALDGAGAFLARERARNPQNYQASLQTTRDLVDSIESRVGRVEMIGVCGPGSISPADGRLRNSNTTWLNGARFREDLQAVLERPVRYANDADCLVLSEATDGAAAGAFSAFGVILGTGCGGGLWINGALVTGRNGFAGEWGHTPLPWPAPDEIDVNRCWCGRSGCMETWVSGTGFQRDFNRTTGHTLPAEAIVEAAAAGRPEARTALDRYVDRVARGLAVVCDVVDPEVIVLGGGMSNIGELYERLPGRIAGHVFSDTFATPVVPARWGDSSGVRGAAWLWPAS